MVDKRVLLMKDKHQTAGEGSNASQRLDKWLKIARIMKTRAWAAAACQDRRVKVNGQIAKAAKMIKPGDTVTIRMKGGKYRNLKVLEISHKSISAKDAIMLYHEETNKLSEEAQELMDIHWQSVKTHRPRYKGRPTKRERREIERFKRS